MDTVGRNEPCPCGSGIKYKRCCRGKETERRNRWSKGLLLIVLGLVAAAMLALALGLGVGGAPEHRRVWDSEHGHYHDVG